MSSPQRTFGSGKAESSQPSKHQSSQGPQQSEQAEAPTHDEGCLSTSDSASENEYRPKRSRQQEESMRLTEEEYIMVAKDIMGKPPFSGYLKYHLPLRYAARCEEVRWVWQDPQTGKNVYKELIGGGRNSDLEYD